MIFISKNIHKIGIMKKIIISIIYCVAFNLSIHAMTYGQAQSASLYLTDKMAYELNLSVEQFEAAYEINLDYFLMVNRDIDLYGVYWSRRNSDLRYVLNMFQYRRFVATNYFYRPLNWGRGGWTLAIYGRYQDPHFFYYVRPRNWNTYRGGLNLDARSRYVKRNFYAPGRNGMPDASHAPIPYNPGNNGNRLRDNYRNGANGVVPPHQNGGFYNDNGNRPQGRGMRPNNNGGNGSSTPQRRFGR